MESSEHSAGETPREAGPGARREALFRTLIEHTPAAVAMFDRKMRYLAWSRRYAEDYGVRGKDLEGRSHYDVFPEIPDQWRKEHAACIRGEALSERVEPFERRDGRVEWVRRELHPWRDADGEIGGIIIFNEVITRQKQAEEALKESRERYRQLVELSPDAVFVLLDGTVAFANREAANFFSVPDPNALIGRPFADLVFEPDREAAVADLDASRSCSIPLAERRFKTAYGSEKWADRIFAPMTFERRPAVFAILRDTTRRRTAERKLADTQALFAAAMEQSPAGIIIADGPDAVITFANSAALGIRGETRDRLSGLTTRDPSYVSRVLTPDGRPVDPEDLPINRAIRKGEIVRDAEYIIRREDGENRWVSSNAAPVRDPEGSIVAGVAVFPDITPRKRAEAALSESEGKYRSLIETTGTGFGIMDDQGRVLDANDAYARLAGERRALDLIGRSLQEWTASHDVKRSAGALKKCLEKGFVQNLEVDYVDREGNVTPVEINATVMGLGENRRILALVRDITDRRKTEEEKARVDAQLRQAQKFEAIGTLAGGVAHDFNNLLMGIQGNASLARSEITAEGPDPKKIEERLTAIEHHVKSAAELTRQLLGFSRGGRYLVLPTDLNLLLEKNLEMFGRTRKEVVIHTDFDPGLWPVEVDRGQVDQVFLNIYVNAWQAMPEGGELFVKTENITLAEGDVQAFDICPGEFVRASVTDTGTGMDKRVLARAFDPFFTTKEKGRGTGLGLASAYGIIKNHGGVIRAYSEPGSGATFVIYFPVGTRSALREKAPVKQVRTGDETILLVDDEPMILSTAARMLENLGYVVIMANGGAQALEAYEKAGSFIDLVILDMIMPGMSGRETFAALKAKNPNIRALLSSGYSVNGQAGEILRDGALGFLQKPFDLMGLSEKVREVLDAPLAGEGGE